MSGLKFLVVDDASFIRDMLKKNLRDNFPGCQVFDVANGKRAQAQLKVQRVDLILCDWEMPEMTGEELLRWIRGHEVYGDLPFIMVTSRGEKDFIVKAVQAGVSDYLGKPFSPETLVTKVTKVLKKSGVKFKEPKKTENPFAGSADILTGSKSGPAKKPAPAKPSGDSASLLMGGGGATPKPKAKPQAKGKSKSAPKGQAQLNFPGFSAQCIINGISLQLLNGAIKRGDQLPQILDPVVISIVQNDGESVARLNGYIHSIQAAENRIDANVLKLVIRFVDDDPDKLEHLSKYISSL